MKKCPPQKRSFQSGVTFLGRPPKRFGCGCLRGLGKGQAAAAPASPIGAGLGASHIGSGFWAGGRKGRTVSPSLGRYWTRQRGALADREKCRWAAHHDPVERDKGVHLTAGSRALDCRWRHSQAVEVDRKLQPSCNICQIDRKIPPGCSLRSWVLLLVHRGIRKGLGTPTSKHVV